MFMRTRTVVPSAVGLIGLALLAGCAAPAEPASSGEHIDGGTVVYAHQQEPACVFGGWIEQAYLSYNVLDSLVSLDENHEVVPWLAESWTQADDGLNLRQYHSFDTARDFAELVVPELRRRGRLPPEGSSPVTLRERLFGAGNARLPDRHIGARYRGGANLDDPLAALELAGAGNVRSF